MILLRHYIITLLRYYVITLLHYYTTSNSRRGGRSGVLEIFIYSFWGTCSPPCARPCAFILFISFDFPFTSFSFLFFIFFFTFIFFFIFSFSFHRHHHRQAGALAGAVDVEDLAVISFTFILFNAAQTQTQRSATQYVGNLFRNSSEILPKLGVRGGCSGRRPKSRPSARTRRHAVHISNGSRAHFSRPGSARLNARWRPVDVIFFEISRSGHLAPRGGGLKRARSLCHLQIHRTLLMLKKIIRTGRHQVATEGLSWI